LAEEIGNGLEGWTEFYFDFERRKEGHGVRSRIWGGDTRKGRAQIDLPGLDMAVSGS
jgi:hypothetical protein